MKSTNKTSVLVLFVLSSLLFVTILSVFHPQQQPVRNSIYAANNDSICNSKEAVCRCNDPNLCYPDGCSRNPGKAGYDVVCTQDYSLTIGPVALIGGYLCTHEPDCCAAAVAAGDIHQCCWVEWASCKPSTCDKIPQDKRSNCGWNWHFHDANNNQYHIGTNTPTGYGCLIGNDPASMTPLCGGANPTYTPYPTSPPYATNTPSVFPSPTTPYFFTPTPTIPVFLPTPTSALFFPSPTRPVGPIPTIAFIGSPLGNGYTPSVPSFQLPSLNIHFPQMLPAVGNVIDRLDQQVPKTLDVFEYIFQHVVLFDRSLENKVNSTLFKR